MPGGSIRETMREQRKVVTALSADIVGSTALGESVDPEDAREIIGEAIARIVLSVEEFGGTVKDLAGDGVLALFGAPVAHEDDPERAVRAALRIRDAIGEYAGEVYREWDLRGFGVRVGIESGLVVVGPVGAGQTIEYGAVGDAINTAARLQAAASPATVLVGGATRALVETLFDWGAEHALDLKGKAEPVVACEVAAARPVHGRPRGFEAPLVGRESELAVLADAAETLLRGSGGVLLLTGDPGVGKSRLLDEFRELLGADYAGKHRPLWLEGRCISYGESLPYLPFRELVRDWLRVPPDEGEKGLRESLRGGITGLVGADAGYVYPYLGAMLGVALEPETRAVLAGLSAATVQRRTFEAISMLLEHLAGRSGLVVAIEDAHWGDATSLQLVEHLIPLAGTEPLLLVITARPDEDHPSSRLREAGTRVIADRFHAIDLEALPAETERELLAALVGGGTVPAELETRILAHAEGNPFFLEELVRSLIDARVLSRENGDWRFEHDVPVEIPSTVERVILARIDRLAPACHDLLTAASVLGRQFGPALLEAVAGESGIAEALSELHRLDFIRLDPRLSEQEYRFRHALIQETAYSTLLKRRRRELHRRAAAALETQFAERPEQAYGLLAHHHRAAGDLDKALEYYGEAADVARRAYAVEEALRLLTAALEVAVDLGLTPESATVGELHRRLGHVHEETGKPWQAQPEYEAALRAGRASGDRHAELRALADLGRLNIGLTSDATASLEEALTLADELGEATTQVTLLSRIAILEANHLRFAEALAYAERALALAEQLGDDLVLSRAMDALKMVAAHTGDWSTLERLTPRLEQIQRRHNELWYLQFTLLESSFHDLANARWDLGLARLEEALQVARRIGDRTAASAILAKLCSVQRARGRYGEALSTGSEAVAMADEVGYIWWWALAGTMLGATLQDLYALEHARRQLDQALEAAEGIGTRSYIFRSLGHAAWAAWQAGDASRADARVTRAERLVAEITTPPGRAFLEGADSYFALARVLLARGEPDRTERLLAPLVEAAEACAWQENIALGAFLIGESLRLRGDQAAAEPRLRRALDVSKAAGLPGAAWRAHAALGGICRSGGRSAESERHVSKAVAIIEELGLSIDEDVLRQQFLVGARAEVGRLASTA